HRGFRNLAPESTIPAFQLASEYGFFGIETDLRPSTDGELFCYHDTDLANFTDGTGSVESKDSQYLKSLTFIKGANIDRYPNTRLCTFEEYLKIAHKYSINIIPEFGSMKGLDKALEKITNYGYWEKTIIQSTNKEVLEYIRNKKKNVPLVYTT